jgi:tetratricopeptide (TPR) repeat protein
MGRIVEIIFNTLLSLIGITFMGWLFWRALKRSDDPAIILFKILFTVALVIGEVFFLHSLIGTLQNSDAPQANAGQAFLMAGSVAACGIILSIVWTAQISNFLIGPLTGMFDGGTTPPEPKPYYSIAIAKRKRNKPIEAVTLVREQLTKFPNDYEGVNLLAGIQAEDLKDLPAAEATINLFCEWDKAPPLQVAAALTQLADWHLKLFQDTYSARIALQRIVDKYPDTDLALVAKQRIAHVGGMGKTLMATHERGPVFVPEGVKNVGLLESSAHLVPTETTPEKQAADYVKQLQEHPDDTEARERLAIIYARHYQRLDLATGELEQMISDSNHPPKRIAHWLNLLADLQVHCGADYETARATLEKIVELFPDYAVAEVARSRLAHLKLEFKALEKTSNKTLGVYEQNIGLKSNRGY